MLNQQFLKATFSNRLVVLKEQLNHFSKCAQHEAGQLLLKEATHMYLSRYPTRQHTCRVITFKKMNSGRPFCVEFPELFVSISHSDATIAVAVSDIPVGIDVQVSRQSLITIAPDFVAPEEAYVLSRCAITHTESLAMLWSVKEAYLKAIGTGLRMHPRKLRVVPIPDRKHTFEVSVSGYPTGRVVAKYDKNGYAEALAVL